MAYEQSFLYSPGEPQKVASDQTGEARSVWSAIHVFQAEHPEQWIAMARECFDLKGPRDAALLQAEGVMARIVETNKFDVSEPRAGAPIRVYIDRKKKFAVEVWR